MMISDMAELREFGFVLSLAIMLDATVMVLVLIPSIMMVASKYNWWLPGRRKAVEIAPVQQKNELTLVAGIILHMSAIRELRMQDVATIFGGSKSTVTDYVNYLEKRGFVSRQKGTEDRRDVFIVPTEKGREWVKRDRTIIRNYTDGGLTRLTPEERKDFIRLLTKFVGDIDQPPCKNLFKNKDGEKAQED